MFGHTHRHCVLYVQTIILLLRIDVKKTNEFNLLQSTELSIIVPPIYLMDIGFEEKEKNERFLKSRLWGQNVFWTKETWHGALFNILYTSYHPCNLVRTFASF
jgi:hypothetical protein